VSLYDYRPTVCAVRVIRSISPNTGASTGVEWTQLASNLAEGGGRIYWNNIRTVIAKFRKRGSALLRRQRNQQRSMIIIIVLAICFTSNGNPGHLASRGGSCRDAGQHDADPGHPGESGTGGNPRTDADSAFVSGCKLEMCMK